MIQRTEKLPQSPAAREWIKRLASLLEYSRYVLTISHSDFLSGVGGVEKLIGEELFLLHGRGVSQIQVCPYRWWESPDGNEWQKWHVVVNVDGVSLGEMSIFQLSAALRYLTTEHAANAVAVHVHHLLLWSLPAARQLIESVGKPLTRFFFHDFHCVCPQYNLLYNKERYCAGPANNFSLCPTCSSGSQRLAEKDSMKEIIDTLADELVVHSVFTKTVIGQAYPEYAERIRVIPYFADKWGPRNPDARADKISAAGYRPRIAFMGHPAAHKGWRTMLTLAADTGVREKFFLYHLGVNPQQIPHVRHVPVSFQEHGKEAMTDALVRENIDMALIWSIGPETYGIVAYEALAANCFILTHCDSGNVADLVRKTGKGVVFNDEAELLAFLHDPAGVKRAVLSGIRKDVLRERRWNSELIDDVAPDAAIPPSRDDEREFALAAIEREFQHAEEVRRIGELQAQLQNYTNSYSHRKVESTKKFLSRHPIIHRFVKALMWPARRILK
jgi:hypothetical protein